MLASDEGFADRVRLWERRLGELHLMVEPVEPASNIWPRIKARMPEVRQFTEASEPEPELQPELQPEAQPQPAPELQPDAEREREPELDQPQKEASSVAEDTFESLMEALQKPVQMEAAAQPEQPIPPPALPAAPAPVPTAIPAPSWHLPPEQTEEPPIAPAPPFVAPAPVEQIEKDAEAVPPQSVRRAQRSLARWRIMAVLLFLALAAIAGIVVAWRFIPDRVPPALQPIALMRLAGIPVPASQPLRKPPPPESTFEE